MQLENGASIKNGYLNLPEENEFSWASGFVAPNNHLEFDSPLGTTIAMWANSQDPNFPGDVAFLFYKGNG